MILLLQTPWPRQKFRVALLLLAAAVPGCRDKPATDRIRVSGQVEATEVHVAAVVGGRVLTITAVEGEHVTAGATLVQLDTADAELQLTRARADRDQADAQLRLLQAGARGEDIRQAEAQVASAEAEVAAVAGEVAGAAADLVAANADVQRFEQLLASNSGSRKQRDDAVARRDVARERERSARERERAAQARVKASGEVLARTKSGARREEVDAARARVAAAAAQIAVWEKAIADATVTAPIAGIVTEKIADVGELVSPRLPLVVITDLEHAWANVYVDEPSVPKIRLGQDATVFTDAGGAGLPGKVSQIADKAEFTPRNVQTADDRSKLVYRVKVTVDNSTGVLKSGMPVEAEVMFGR
jgi:HlyD family secretion protein